MGNDMKSAEGQSRRLDSVYEQLAALWRRPETSQALRTPTSAGEWSAMQVMGHMIEMMPYWLKNFRTVIATTGAPPKIGRAQDSPERLGGAERGARGNPTEMLERLGEEVHAAAAAFRSMSPADREKKAVHVARGEMTIADMIEVFVVSHSEEHLEQVRAALKT